MKKSSIITIFFALSLFIFQGCSLDEDPKTFISPSAFFTNPDSYEAAVKGIYTDVPSLNELSMSELFSDIYASPSPQVEQALPAYRNASEAYFYNTRNA